MRGQNDDKPNQKAQDSQRLAGISGSPKPSSPSLTDKKFTRTSRLKRRKKGGWKALKGLRLTQVEAVYRLRKEAAAVGTPLNYFTTIKPQEVELKNDDAACKRYLSNKAKNLIQAIKGYGKEPRQETVPCVTVYEKRLGGHLHCHMLLHVKNGNDALERLSDGLEVDTRRAHTNSVGYITKTRLPVGDAATEASYPHKRQGGQAAIKGARISFNIDAKALLSTTSTVAVIAASEPVSVTPVTVTPEQLALPLDTPSVNLMALVEAKRQSLHLPQSIVAYQLGGLKQPAYANALRGHDKLGPWRRNRALEWLAAA